MNTPVNAAPATLEQMQALIQQSQAAAASMVASAVPPAAPAQQALMPWQAAPQQQGYAPQGMPQMPQQGYATQGYAPQGMPQMPQQGYAPPVAINPAEIMVTTAALPAGQRFSYETIGSAGGMITDHFFKFKQGQVKIDDMPVNHPVRCMIDITEVAYKMSIRVGTTNPKYFSTYDGRISDQGGSWEETVRKCKMQDPNTREYRSADLCFTLLDAAIGPDGQVKVLAGKKIGYSPSATAYKDWARVVDAAIAQGKTKVELQVGCVNLSKPGKDWTGPTFTVISMS